MKLIVDIPEETYEYIKITSNSVWLTSPEFANAIRLTSSEYAHAIVNGTPLDSVKAEIDIEWANTHHMYPDYAGGLARASEIIDKHIGNAEREE